MKEVFSVRLAPWKIDVLKMLAFERNVTMTKIVEDALEGKVNFETHRKRAAFFVAERERLNHQSNDTLKERLKETPA